MYSHGVGRAFSDLEDLKPGTGSSSDHSLQAPRFWARAYMAVTQYH